MQILRVHRWVIWWIYVGLICGTIAVVNILAHSLTPRQDRILIVMGAAHWLLGGIVCWASEGVKMQSRDSSIAGQKAPETGPATEWHPASDFLIPGVRRTHSLR